MRIKDNEMKALLRQELAGMVADMTSHLVGAQRDRHDARRQPAAGGPTRT